jgi:hypothetical protein
VVVPYDDITTLYLSEKKQKMIDIKLEKAITRAGQLALKCLADRDK